jgi:hypothetical protein
VQVVASLGFLHCLQVYFHAYLDEIAVIRVTLIRIESGDEPLQLRPGAIFDGRIGRRRSALRPLVPSLPVVSVVAIRPCSRLGRHRMEVV